MPFTGWKSYMGALIIGVGAVLTAVGKHQYVEMMYAIGAALGITGIRSKMERDKPNS